MLSQTIAIGLLLVNVFTGIYEFVFDPREAKGVLAAVEQEVSLD